MGDYRFLLDKDNTKDHLSHYEYTATDDTIRKIVKDILWAKGEDADLNNIDVSAVTNMSNVFDSMGFRGDISQWDVSNVKTFRRMFNECTKFDCDISNWNTKNAVDMSEMFRRCHKFNQPIGKWDVNNAKDMSAMFYNCYNFDQDLGDWDVRKVKYMTKMFMTCSDFKGTGIGKWNMRNVEDISWMLYCCDAFSEDITNWKLHSVEKYEDYFYGTDSLQNPRCRPMISVH